MTKAAREEWITYKHTMQPDKSSSDGKVYL